MRKRKTAIALSGGVDSAVAAWILTGSGRDLFAVTLRLYDEDTGGRKSCCSLQGEARARRVAHMLGIPFYVLDEREFFEEEIVSRFVSDYLAGLTPNPCVMCNSLVKFGKLLSFVKALGAECIATGHYARVQRKNGSAMLMRGADPLKDQSYMLSGLAREVLNDVVFPLGDMTKKQTLKLARRNGLLPGVSVDSQEICFAGERGYRKFLASRIGEEKGRGIIVDSSGKKLGTHSGVWNFTVGQRRGLKLSAGRRLYVLKLDAEKRLVVVGDKKELFRKSFVVKDCNWFVDVPRDSLECQVKIRYTASAKSARLSVPGDGTVLVELFEEERAVTPGQRAVFFKDEVVLGGGTIAKYD